MRPLQHGDLVYLSGRTPVYADGSRVNGKVGSDLTLEQGYEGARQAAVNLLNELKEFIGDLDRVTQVIKLLCMVKHRRGFLPDLRGIRRGVRPAVRALRRTRPPCPFRRGHRLPRGKCLHRDRDGCSHRIGPRSVAKPGGGRPRRRMLPLNPRSGRLDLQPPLRPCAGALDLAMRSSNGSDSVPSRKR